MIVIKVKLPSGFDIMKFKEASNIVRSSYPEQFNILEVSGQFQAGEGSSVAQTASNVIGFGFKSDDKRNVVQFRREGFTYNRLKPYTSWTEVRTEALRVWDIYKKIASPGLVTRIAARYINHLNVPLAENLLDYIYSPTLPNETQAELNGFLTRFAASDRVSSLQANITQALERALDQKSLNVILDIEVYKQGQYDPETDAEKIVTDFERIREFKNRIFFAYITEKTARLFE